MNRLLAFVEVALAVFSFLFFKTVKFLVRRLLSLYYRIAVSQGFRWKFASAALMEMPGALPMIMTTGPRWNTHAILGTAGPVAVKRSMAVDVGAAQRSAEVWTLVVSSYPGYRTVTTIGSRDQPFSDETVEIALEPGKYWMALRYYHWNETVELPAISIDGNFAINSVAVPPDVNDFYRTLADKSNLFYLCLHYYVHVMLRHRNWLPAAFVEREFVPLGNPETRFLFGYVGAGECLSVRIEPDSLISSDIYITMYNHCSFPVASYHVTVPDFVTSAAPRDTVYLMRVHDKTAVPVASRAEGPGISVKCLPT